MDPNVSLKRSSPCAGIVALRATKRRFPCMNLPVFLESAGLCERDITYVTTEQFFAGMYSRVHLEVTRISKGGITLQAREGLLATVNQHMSL